MFPLLTGKGTNEKHLIIVISSDRGLCGGLNSATAKFTKNKINELISQGRQVKIMCVGRKAFEQLRPIHGNKIVENFSCCIKGNLIR